MGRLKTLIFSIVSLFLNIIGGVVVYYFWQPIASWYFNYRPILGVDFYSLASFVGYLSRHFVFQFNGWKYIWWTGVPLSMDYPTFHAYLILPLLNLYTIPQAILLYVTAATFLFLFFSYLLFVELSKDRVLAAILAIATSFSIGVYGAMVWGGSLNYYVTQTFFPLTLWLLVKFFNSLDKRWFYLSALSMGFSFLGHPQVGFSFLMPIVFLLLLTCPLEGEKYISFSRIKRIIAFFILAVLSGYPQLSIYLGKNPLEIFSTVPSYALYLIGKLLSKTAAPSVTSDVGKISDGAVAITQWKTSQLNRLFTDVNYILYVFLAISIGCILIAFILHKKRAKSFSIFVYMLPIVWIVFTTWLFVKGIAIFQGEWYRIFWAFPVVLGMFISFAWGDLLNSIIERFGFLGKKVAFRIILLLISGFSAGVVGFILLPQYSAPKMLSAIETPGYRQGSSAYPDSLNYYVDKTNFKDLSTRLTPNWLDPNNTQYRFYDADQRVNIWWNAVFDMPIVKGYIEVPPGDATGAFYWTSIAITQHQGNPLVKAWGNPEEIAYNNALFLIDWFSIKYIEAEHTWSDSYNPLTSYLAESDIFEHKEKIITHGWGQLYEVPQGKSLTWHPNEEQHLTYYGIKDEYVSPILHTTDAKVIGVIGEDNAYMTIFRTLAATNLNSRKIIPVRLGKFIDDVSVENLKDMDALILYAYDYKNHNNAWKKLSRYVEGGGKVYVETGSEVKQTDSVNLPSSYPKVLPEIFPINVTKRIEVGKEWSLESGKSKETEGIDLGSFGAPIIDNKPWQFSVPNSASDVREGAQIIISNKDIPFMAYWKFGQGSVIWSGMNLPYHMVYHKNVQEAYLFKNIIAGIVDIKDTVYSNYNTQRVSPNKVVLKGINSKGAIFRESAYPGWSADINSKTLKRSIRIYKAGPTHYGFSYVRIPQDFKRSSFMITYTYRGEFWSYFWIVLWFLTIIFVLDRVIFGSRVIVPILNKISARFRFKIGKWWERDEE